MEKLTSRKLAIAIITIIALVALVPLVGYFPDVSDFAGNALIAVATVGLTAIGGQFLLDNLKGGN